MKTVKMKCQSCGGTLDAQENVLFCPYCGEKTMMVEDDEIKLAKIDADIRKHDNETKLAYEELRGKNEQEVLRSKEFLYAILILSALAAIAFIALSFMIKFAAAM